MLHVAPRFDHSERSPATRNPAVREHSVRVGDDILNLEGTLSMSTWPPTSPIPTSDIVVVVSDSVFELDMDNTHHVFDEICAATAPEHPTDHAVGAFCSTTPLQKIRGDGLGRVQPSHGRTAKLGAGGQVPHAAWALPLRGGATCCDRGQLTPITFTKSYTKLRFNSRFKS